MTYHEAVDFKAIKPQLWEMEGISARTMDEHMKLYRGYVSKFNEVMDRIKNLPEEEFRNANPTYSLFRGMKVDITRAIGGIKNHEIYFSNLGGSGGTPSGSLLQQIEQDFGSFDRFMLELRATAVAARGWAWVAWDYDFQRLLICLGDEQNVFPLWNAEPILAIDVFEHAFFMDHGANKGAYLDAFFRNLDWADVQQRFEKLRR